MDGRRATAHRPTPARLVLPILEPERPRRRHPGSVTVPTRPGTGWAATCVRAAPMTWTRQPQRPHVPVGSRDRSRPGCRGIGGGDRGGLASVPDRPTARRGRQAVGGRALPGRGRRPRRVSGALIHQRTIRQYGRGEGRRSRPLRISVRRLGGLRRGLGERQDAA